MPSFFSLQKEEKGVKKSAVSTIWRSPRFGGKLPTDALNRDVYPLPPPTLLPCSLLLMFHAFHYGLWHRPRPGFAQRRPDNLPPSGGRRATGRWNMLRSRGRTVAVIVGGHCVRTYVRSLSVWRGKCLTYLLFVFAPTLLRLIM